MNPILLRWITAASILLCLALSSRTTEGAVLTVRDGTYTSEEFPSESAFIVENGYYSATVVPGKGGRILSLRDKVSGKSIVMEKGYGGLLDDHGDRYIMPYTARWIKRTSSEASIEMTLQGELSYKKTVTFFADRPVIQVDYVIANKTQKPQRMLFRNVVRPSGIDFTDRELYCFSRVVGLQRAKGMPRTDDQADPWCALIDTKDRMVVANFFEGDILARLYTWSGSRVAPTYEFMFPNLQPGRSISVRYYWIFCHGISAVDYSHRAFSAQIEGSWDGNTLKTRLDVIGTWQPMPDLKISGEVLDTARNPIAKIPESNLPVTEIDKLVKLPIKSDAVVADEYVILLLRLSSKELPGGVVVEKAFPRNGNEKLLAGYTRPVRWIGPPVQQKPIPGWVKEEKYTITPSAEDKARGWMLFEESGPKRGNSVRQIPFDMMQNEPEGFPVHLYSISVDGNVAISCEAPAGFTIESFIPEPVEESLWQEKRYGLKLNPGKVFSVKPGDDRTLFFRLSVVQPAPGKYTCRITFTPQGKKPLSLDIPVTVHPVKFSRRPYMVLDVNNVANYLCARQEKGVWKWDAIRAENYLSDMERHGVLTQTVSGTNSPDSYRFYHLVRDRETGLSLPEAIKKNPERYKTAAPPPLDFSEWDWFFENLLTHGMSHIRFPLGGCGERFMSRHNALTKLVYGKTFTAGDVRHLAVQEWFDRELVRYMKDKGFVRILCTIDDEIPSEKMAWWVQHAFRASKVGFEPGVTISARTLESDTIANIISPFMRYWIIGTFGKESLNRRRSQNIIRPEDWVTTYHSSACHWQPYDEMRGHCGIRNAYVDLDACWIQVYYRWRQSEAVIYPGEDGPVSSAAWEGARDGLDDANVYLLAKRLAENLPDEKERADFSKQIEKFVGPGEDSLISIRDRETSLGTVTDISNNPDTWNFREAKRGLLSLVGRMAAKVTVQRANVLFRNTPIISNGVPNFAVAGDVKRGVEFFTTAAGNLASQLPKTASPLDTYGVFFCGTYDQMVQTVPSLAKHPELSDISPAYPSPGTYIIRLIERPAAPKGKGPVGHSSSMVVIGGDEKGTAKGLSILGRIVSFPKTQYSHWLVPAGK